MTSLAWPSCPILRSNGQLKRVVLKTDRYGPQYDQRCLVGRVGKATSGFKECQQVGVELALVRVREAVGCARVNLQGRVPDQLR